MPQLFRPRRGWCRSSLWWPSCTRRDNYTHSKAIIGSEEVRLSLWRGMKGGDFDLHSHLALSQKTKSTGDLRLFMQWMGSIQIRLPRIGLDWTAVVVCCVPTIWCCANDAQWDHKHFPINSNMGITFRFASDLFKIVISQSSLYVLAMGCLWHDCFPRAINAANEPINL